MKPAIIRKLPPEPNPLDVFKLMVHDSLWDEIATETNRFAVQYHTKSQFPYKKPIVPYNITRNESLLCVTYPHGPSKKTKLIILLEHP
jgi:hypothetical protein